MADETQPLPEARTGPDGSPAPDATAPMPASDGPAPDATARMPAADLPGSDASRPDAPGPDPAAPTEAMPAAGGAAGGWSARAAVRPGEVAPADQDESPVDPYGGRNWFAPVLIGGLVLVLLAMLGTGVWLIVHNARDKGTGPGAPASVSASATPSASPPSPRTTAPSPTAAPTTSAAQAGLPVPNVVGSSESAATAALNGMGFTVRVTHQPDGTVAPGTVLSTDPAPGTPLPPGSQVTIVVASAPPVATTTRPAPSASASHRG